MDDVTLILEAIERGEASVADRLLPLVYDELRRLAARQLSNEAPGHTLDATALVHEAYLRLVGGGGEPQWENRRHFFGAAAEAMRRILVESARRRGSLKRGGGLARCDMAASEPTATEPVADLVAVHEALDRLAAADPQAAELVKLRYFAGLTLPQVARLLGISPRTADRLWAYARAWLYREVGGE